MASADGSSIQKQLPRPAGCSPRCCLHQFDQAAGDGQADAGAFDILTRQALEGAEDAVHLFGAIPAPVSWTPRRSRPSNWSQLIRASPSGRLYLMALETRLMTTCLSRGTVGAHRQFRRNGMDCIRMPRPGGQRRDEVRHS